MIAANEILSRFAVLIEEERAKDFIGELKVGVDLGTANIVISVVDQDNEPVAGATFPSTVVKDGIVVDFVGAVKVLKMLKSKLEQLLGQELINAATAVPPGILEGNKKCIANVVEAAGFEVINVVDEPTAAADVLSIKNGAVVDVGGGTTGISILKDGKVIFTADEPTGGTHMTLAIAGYYGVSIAEAEEIKKDISKENDNFAIIKPVAQKMASIVKQFLKDFEVEAVYIVGGACCFSEFEAVFEKEVGIRAIKSAEPLLVTPLGIAFNCLKN